MRKLNSDVVLPTEKTDGFIPLEELKVLLFGNPKIGKSTFCSQIPDSLFLATEKGYGALKIYSIDIINWDDYLRSIRLLKVRKHKFKAIVIDTIDELYKIALRQTCRDLRVDDPSDARWGKGYNKVESRFSEGIAELLNLKMCVFFVSHAKAEEYSTRALKYTRISPTLKKQARNIILPICDIIGYAYVHVVEKAGNFVEKRVITFKPSDELEVGDRTGRLPSKILLNYNKFKEAYNAGREK